MIIQQDDAPCNQPGIEKFNRVVCRLIKVNIYVHEAKHLIFKAFKGIGYPADPEFCLFEFIEGRAGQSTVMRKIACRPGGTAGRHPVDISRRGETGEGIKTIVPVCWRKGPLKGFADKCGTDPSGDTAFGGTAFQAPYIASEFYKNKTPVKLPDLGPTQGGIVCHVGAIWIEPGLVRNPEYLGFIQITVPPDCYPFHKFVPKPFEGILFKSHSRSSPCPFLEFL